MILSLIAAISENNVIGKDGGIPWHLPTDLKLFKQITMGHHLVVGRKTFTSIGKALPGRKMIVLSQQEDYHAEGCVVAKSLTQAMEIARDAKEDELFIGGGAAVYAQALSVADRIYLSRVHIEVDGDTYFPEYNEKHWRVELSHDYPAGPNGEPSFTYQVLVSK